MAEPVTTLGLLAKWSMMSIGSICGSSVALVAAPAVSLWDAKLRFLACLMFTMCIAPAAVRGVVRWCGISDESILDTTLAVSCVCGVVSWWLIHGFIAVAKKHSEGVAEYGLANLLPGIKKKKEGDQP